MTVISGYKNKIIVSLAISAVLLTGCASAPGPRAIAVGTVPVERTAVSTALPLAVKSANFNVKTSHKVHLRRSNTSASPSLGLIPKNTLVKATAVAANGWYKVSYKSMSGYVSNDYAKKTNAAKPASATKPAANSGGRFVNTGKYSTNRGGLTDRYFTKYDGADLYRAVGGSKRIGDIPRNSIVYRDLKSEKRGGQRSGWYFVRTHGTSGWMKASGLKRDSNAPTANTKNYTRAQVRKQVNGKVPTSMLVAIPWDTEKTLISAPALKDLTRMNEAFKKKFGKNIHIDLAYRTRATQDMYWRELGSLIAARPGTSNHGWGMAIDVPETYDYSFRGKYYKWLKANSKKYNWVHQSYLEEYRNGRLNPYREAWHFEYVGK